MKRIVQLIWTGLALTLLAPPAVFAGVNWTLPYDCRGKPVKSLYQAVDENLEKRLAKTLNANPKWKSLIRKKKMTVGIVDIANPEAVRFARVNGRVMMYAASLPKIAVLLAATQALEERRIRETPEILADMRRMISLSDNAAATRMIDRLGFDYIERVLTSPEYRFYSTARGGGLWVGKRYAATGERRPEQLKGLSHAATVTQVCRFYYMLAMGRLVNPQRSRQMLEMLADPELHHKFVGVLDKRAPEATLFRKSGTWKNWHADSVLVWGPGWRRYIAVALVEDPQGEAILQELIAVIDTLLEREHARTAARKRASAVPPAEERGRGRLEPLIAAAAAIEDMQPGIDDRPWPF